MNFANVLDELLAKKDLPEAEAFLAMKAIFSGSVPPAQIAAFLAALRAKGESAGELAGFVKALRDSMTRVESAAPVVLDTCGTGGDGKGTFNISTAAAFVIAGAGVPVAKHGNRSISSRCGSADVLEAAGVRVDMPKETAERCLRGIGITFLLAPLYHPAMKSVALVRKELGIRTVFNFLGPLANPAGANAQVVGVPNRKLVPLIAKIFQKLNGKDGGCAFVVHEAGYDEVVLAGCAEVVEVRGGRTKSSALSPEKFGMRRVPSRYLQGGDATENALLLRDILSGKMHPLQDVVAANAALGLMCADLAAGGGRAKAYPFECVRRARESVQSGAALKKLDELIEGSRA